MDPDFHLRCEEETSNLGFRLGRVLRPGQVVDLNGPLGAGKTVFVKGIARALGIDPDKITSPTFTYIHNHVTPAGWIFHHIDLYRVQNAQEAVALGLEDVFSGNGVVAVEWAERAPAWIRADTIRVDIAFEENGRRITLGGPFVLEEMKRA